MYLLKYLAQAGVASRRQAEKLIREGHTTVDGQKITEPGHEISNTAEIAVNDQVVTVEPREYYLVNKPLGVISTVQDTHGRPIVTELVPSKYRLYPVGRLDADTSGLIMLTNDGELANRLIHPRYEVPKTYHVTVEGTISDGALHKLRNGVVLDDGPTAPAEVTVLERGTATSLLEMTIREGRNRQIRRMGEAVGYPVTALQRRRIGGLALGSLAPGKSRRLSPVEVRALKALLAE